MSRKSQVKAVIDAHIKRNGKQQITGDVLNGVLNTLLDAPVIDIIRDGQVLPKDADGNVIVTGDVTKEYVDTRTQAAYAAAANKVLEEEDRAKGVEAELSQRIDTIIQGRNVRDIVANYDELLTYDTSTLGDNDIVMVLLDATKSGHTTYYRWKEAEGEWEFIGGLAFTYTTTEIDDKFAALHIVLPTIPADAVENPEEYQELLAQVDSMVRSAGSDASFKMPVLVVDGISGNVDVTFVKSNPAHLYLGIFADDMSTLYHITRTISTPRTYSLQIVEKMFQPKLTPGSGITIEDNVISATGGESDEWDEEYDITLESDARLVFHPSKPVKRVYMHINRPAGSAASQMRFSFANESISTSYTCPSFNANMQVMITCTASVVESMARVYSDAQTIYSIAGQYWANAWGAKNIASLGSVSNFEGGTRIVIKAKY